MPQSRRCPLTAKLLSICLGATFIFAGVLPAAADPPTNDIIVVRFADSVAGPGSSTVPAAEMAKLTQALESGFQVAGRTRDGAYRFKLAQPLTPEAMREAVTQIRLTANVLYVNGEVPVTTATNDLGTDRVIVKFKPDGTDPKKPLNENQLARLSQLTGGTVTWHRNTPDGGHILKLNRKLPPGAVAAMAKKLANQPDIEYAEPDDVWESQLVATDPCYATNAVGCNGYQWDLFDAVGGINAPAAWDVTTGSATVRVAVIDTGALLAHPDLAGRFVGGYDMASDAANANDGDARDADASDPGDWVTAVENSSGPFAGCGAGNSSWHGSHVAGTIGASPNNGAGIAGINWTSGIVPVRVLGKCGGYMTDINDAIIWAAGGTVAGVPDNPNPARVLNLSLGGGGACPASTQDAINKALGMGAVVVVAAGNSNTSAANSTPGNCNGVITVAATTKAGGRATYSNYGTAVEIAAPGGDATAGGFNILSTINSGAMGPDPAGYIYGAYAGTSMATPHVAGVASLMFSVNPQLTPTQLLGKLQASARLFPTGSTCTTAICGSGIVNAGQAVALAGTGPVASTTTLVTSLASTSYGTAVTFTASVTGSTPTGTVAFKDNGTDISGCSAITFMVLTGTVKTAKCTTSTLTVGSHSVTATYSGNWANLPSTSAPVTETVGIKTSVTRLTTSKTPVAVGTAVTFTASVTGGLPTGTVTFKDGGVVVPSCAAVALIGTAATRTAPCVLPNLTAGTHAITAAYSGDAGNTPSTSAIVSEVVIQPKATTTTVVGPAAASIFGDTLTFTATIVGGNVPTGTVLFKDNGYNVVGCTAIGLVGTTTTKTAKCVLNTWIVGSHSITATYGGDLGSTTSSSSAVTQTVGMASSTTKLSASTNPSLYGATTLIATVTGGLPSGSVIFKDGGTVITGCGAVVTAGAGQIRTAKCVVPTLAVGVHTITADYLGNAGTTGSSATPYTQTVNPANTTTRITSSLNPSALGTSVKYTATVVGNLPTGTVAFSEGSAALPGCEAVALVGTTNVRTAVCNYAAATAGLHLITGKYSGNTNNAISMGSFTETVN